MKHHTDAKRHRVTSGKPVKLKETLFSSLILQYVTSHKMLRRAKKGQELEEKHQLCIYICQLCI